MKVPYMFVPAQSEGDENHLYILGDITEWDDFDWGDGGSPQKLKRQLADSAGDLVVHIDSYGGHTSAGITMYNLLKQYRGAVTTVAEGFVCSAASLVYMAGDTRIMRPASLLMIHNAWCEAVGNADQLRKQADDLDIISKSSAQIYVDETGLSAEEVEKLMDEETWISPEDALRMGFCTAVSVGETEEKAASSAFRTIMSKLLEKREDTCGGETAAAGNNPSVGQKADSSLCTREPQCACGRGTGDDEEPAHEPEAQPEEAVKPDKSALQRWFGY